MFSLVRRDWQRYFALDSRDGAPGLLGKLWILLDTPGLHATLVYRFGSWIERHVRVKVFRYALKALYYVADKLVIICWGIHIDQRAQIGGGLYIGHFGGVLIGPITMGSDCNLAHHVTIGRRADGKSGVPVLGNRVWVGAGSVLFGGIHIGDGVTVGPNTVVARNLPPRALVIGNPMKILSRNYDNTAEVYGAAQAMGSITSDLQ